MERFDQLEYLLAQSAQGVHLLFDNISIAKILGKTDGMVLTIDNMGRAQKMLTHFLELETFWKQKAYLEGLLQEDYELFIRLYFQIVEGAVLAASRFKH